MKMASAMLIVMLFLRVVSLSLCAQPERCCIHGILPLYSFLEEIQWYNQLFQSLKLEMKIFQSIANPHRRPRPSSLFSVSAVQERSGWRDGFKTCDCSRESCALSEMRLRGCTSPSVTSECADLLHLCLFKPYWEQPLVYPGQHPCWQTGESMKTRSLSDWNPSGMKLHTIWNKRNYSGNRIYKHHNMLMFQTIITHFLALKVKLNFTGIAMFWIF